jgi:preprotein translocase subunit SecA
MLDSLRSDVTSKLARIQPLTPEQQAEIIRQLQAQQAAQQKELETADVSAGGAGPRRSRHTAGRGVRRHQPRHMGQPGPQRSLPLRVGQEVQALPRTAGLTRHIV